MPLTPVEAIVGQFPNANSSIGRDSKFCDIIVKSSTRIIIESRRLFAEAIYQPVSLNLIEGVGEDEVEQMFTILLIMNICYEHG